MQRIHPELATALGSDATIVVESPQRASALRAAFAAEQIAAGRSAWRTPRAVTFYTWARQALGVQCEVAAANAPRLLSEREEWALTRDFAHHIAPAYEFAARRALAHQLRSANVLLDEWQLRGKLPQLRHWPESELLRSGLDWLATRHTDLDAAPLRSQLKRLRPQSTPLTTISQAATPLQADMLARLDARLVATGQALGDAHVLGCTTIEDECAAVAEWSRAQLLANPACKLLVVAPDLAVRRARLERTLSQTLEPTRWLDRDDGSRAFAIEGGRALSSFSLVATALTSLRLLTRPLAFESVSSWLRAPFSTTLAAADLARFDVFLRESAQLQLTWQQLAAVANHERAPPGSAALASRLHDGHAKLPRGKASPIAWAQAFEGGLRALGWPGERTLGSELQQVRQRWQELLGEFATLGQVWQALEGYQAVDALAEIAEQIRFDVASDDVPVLVTDAMHNPVVTYDGIWVMGLDSDTWPPAPTPHPLIPLAWQLEAGIPEASNERLHAKCAALLTTWRSHATQLVLSAPRTRDDSECTPSSLLAGLPSLPNGNRLPTLAAALRGSPRFDEEQDYLGVPLARGSRAKHGTRVFDLQARCPFRAYGELRLGARALEKPQAGVDQRDRGNWLHEALALFWRDIGSSAALAALDDTMLEKKAANCVTAAQLATQPRWRAAVTQHSIRREALRLRELLVAGARLERQRPAFTVRATEHTHRTVFEGIEFRFKIDRIDAIDRGIAIIDYKSGADQYVDWSSARPESPQLLAYSVALSDQNVEAFALQFLSRRAARYRGASATANALPGVTLPGKRINQRVPDEDAKNLWAEASRRWHEQIAQLAREYTTGDSRVAPTSLTVCEQCHLSALCRRAELSLEENLATDGPMASIRPDTTDA